MSRSHAHNCWCAMTARCMNPKDAAFDRYGGRGITVCERWHWFEPFFEDMGESPSRFHSIERKDNDLGYSPENCRWATDAEQANNTRRNVFVTRDGITMTVSQWCRALKLPGSAVRQRIYRGMSPEDALATPLRAARA